MAVEPLDLDAVKAALAQPETGPFGRLAKTETLADYVPALVVEIERLTIENRRLYQRLTIVQGQLLAVAALCAPAEDVPDGC